MRGIEMPLQEADFRTVRPATSRDANDWRARALRLLCVLAMGTMLAACGRCGDFLSSSLVPAPWARATAIRRRSSKPPGAAPAGTAR